MYKIDSQKAEEFICHEEILDTLEYAQSKSQDKELIRSIIEKARLCKGLSPRGCCTIGMQRPGTGGGNLPPGS